MDDFLMPKVAMSDDEEMIVTQWLLAEGDTFEEGQPLLEVETAKASMEIEATDPGVLAVQVRKAGDTVLAGDLVARLARPGESYDTDRGPVGSTTRTDSSVVSLVASTVAEPALVANVPPIPVPPPAARGKAEELSSSASQFAAAGELYGVPLRKRMARIPSVGGASSAAAASPTREPLSRHRRALARLMTESARIPQFAVQRDLPMLQAVRTVERLRAEGHPVTLTDVVLRVTAAALLQHPELNSRFVDDDVFRYAEPAIALAAASPGGVVAPVIREAHRLLWQDLARERRRVVEGARNGRLLPSDLAGGTFAISNVGALGGDAVVPMLTPPQVAVLGLGRTRPGWGETVACAVLVADHRVLDGADAARFLATLAELFLTIDDGEPGVGGRS
ncbi:dihydrolipoamide acetyltransferase family protein [Kribbella sancticallisti]|uniref:Dihydrolipoamide acetyltransferase component of pyruvate dehydrogenase complex n=1 Tax=Kribbella sancticallisti TaxID=460087 RepID=A0ABP4QXT8_9ACTN